MSSVAATWIAALATLRNPYNDHDYTYKSWRYYLCVDLVQGLAVIAQCIPYIRNLMIGLDSGMIRTGHFRLRSNSKSGQKASGGSSGQHDSSGSWGISLQSQQKSSQRGGKDIELGPYTEDARRSHNRG